MAETVAIVVDGRRYEAPAGKNLLQACLDLGLMVPHFCYHEALGAAGACRLCAVMVAPAPDKPMRLDMACMVRVADGMVVSIADEAAKRFRKGVIEELMLNHPHDCPVCDEGGECMLQNMTVLAEHQHRRARFPKRTWENQYLGPLIHHEMNRCITCYRCVRFYRDYALGTDLGVFGSRSRVYFGRFREGVLESPFSGNLVDVCPTGVFTDKRYRQSYCRPWDLMTARSVCTHCSVGCGLLVGGRHGTLRRIKPLAGGAVNRFFICDRGRYGGEYVNGAGRLGASWVGKQETANGDAVRHAARQLRAVVEKHGPRSVAGIGSARASLEANAALVAVLKSLGGDRGAFFLDDAERGAARRAAAITTGGRFRVPSLDAIEKADFVLIAGGDVSAEAPMMDLAVRQAVRAGAACFIASPRAGVLDAHAAGMLRVKPGAEAGVLRAAAARVPAADSAVEGGGGFEDVLLRALRGAARPVVLCSAYRGDTALVDAAAALAGAVNASGGDCGLAYWFHGPNAVGAGLARQDEPPGSIREDIRRGAVRAVIMLEPLLDSATAALPVLDEFLHCELLVAVDGVEQALTEAAHIVLACASHYESAGTFVNYEGRAQRFEGLRLPRAVTASAGEMLYALANELGGGAIADALNYHDVYDLMPDIGPRIDSLEPGSGVVVKGTGAAAVEEAVPPESVAGDPALWRVVHLHGSDALAAMAPPVAELAPPACVEMHPGDAAARGLAENQKASLPAPLDISGVVRMNSGLARGTVAVPLLCVPRETGQGGAE